MRAPSSLELETAPRGGIIMGNRPTTPAGGVRIANAALHARKEKETNMARINRRDFLKGSLATAGGIALFNISGTRAGGQIIGANDRIRIAVAGLHGRGGSHMGAFAGMNNVEVAYVVDPDATLLPRAIGNIKKRGKNTPKGFQDIRKALEDKDLTAVSIATPNHWHSLMTIWACQAGKHVYVEKPCSHDVFEGRTAVAASRKYNVIVQHGTQQRSSSGRANQMAAIHAGVYGKLLVSHGYCCKPRGSIGSVTKPTPIPDHIDYDLWCGPAPKVPLMRKRLHYDWHWFWDTGNGDIGNQGVHEMDVARWALSDQTLPVRVMSLGGRFGWNDQGQTPNSQFAVMEFPNGQYLLFTVRNLNHKGYKRQVKNDFYFDAGKLVNGRFTPKGGKKPEKVEVPKAKITGGGTFGSFIATVRAGKREMTNADILDGHYSSSVGHLANISFRLGKKAPFNEKAGRFGDNKAVYDGFMELHSILKDDAKLPVDKTEYMVGPWLTFDPKTEKFTGDRAKEANTMLHEKNRKGFEVPAPDKV